MIWRHSPHVAQVRSESADRVALLHLDATQPVVLEGTAAAIWKLIDGQRNEDAILTELAAAFRDESGQMQVQLEGFLAQLQAQGLIEVARRVTH